MLTERRTLIELALKGLESEGIRISNQMMSLRRELAGSGGPQSRATSTLQSQPKKKSGGLTAAGRKKLSLAMKKRWAEKRKATKVVAPKK